MTGVAPEVLREVQRLYDAGQMLDAYRAAGAGPALKDWTGDARTLAGRLAGNLGAPRLGSVLHWKSWKEDRTHPDRAAYYAHVLMQRRGPLRAWEFLEQIPPPLDSHSPDARMHLFTVRAMVLAHLRDFAGAQQALQRAEQCGTFAWLPTCRAYIYEAQDRYEEALESAQAALKLQPWYRAGVQAAAHALQLLDRDEEALALLTEATQHIQNANVTYQLAILQMELGRYGEAAASFAAFEPLAPLLEKDERESIRRHQTTLACYERDTARALTLAREIDEPFHRELAQRLEAGGPWRSVKLDVPFVRQHHMTCAPATLSAVSRFWQKPAEHLEIAEAICYDGTPAHSERHWAETHGWYAREFTVTWESATRLIDAGIPFTLTTSEATSAHLQAVVGYDELRQTLFIRDPYSYYTAEGVIKPLLERYRATGPRGMALVPLEREASLRALELPDAALYDELFALQQALFKHDRARATQVLERMQSAAPGHRLTLTAERSLASYDGNTPALLQALNALLALFPDDENLNLCKLSALREMARRQERIDLLSGLANKRGSDPIFWQQYGHELRADARERAAARTWFRWALRYRPQDPDLISAWADLLWDEREFEKATKYYRITAAMGDKREHFSQSFFTASRHLRQTDIALEFLRDRNQRLGAKSCDPAITLIQALHQIGRSAESFKVLDAALARRPDDGSLRLFAAEFNGRFGKGEAANRWLAEARDHCPAADWHRQAALIADYQADKTRALEHWRAVLKLQPLAHHAIRPAALLIAETEGRDATLKFLDDLCGRFPYSCPLLTLRIEWLREEGGDRLITRLRELLQINPMDAWGWRELALHLPLPEALDATNEAIRLEPHMSQGYGIRGDLHFKSDRFDEARADWLQAICLEIDNGYAVSRFVNHAPTLLARKEALTVVAEELRRQVIFGGALHAYRDAARGILQPAEVLQILREAHQARPDLWQAWSVLINELIDTGDYDAAFDTATKATQEFPLTPAAWVDLARVAQARLDTKAEIEALENALQINATYSYAARQLASIFIRENELARARSVMERIIVASPLEAVNYCSLAIILWRLGERDAAVERVRQALRLEPGLDWGWGLLREWQTTLNQPTLAADVARDLAQRRAGEARSWLFLARSLSLEQNRDEVFAALDRAVELNPRCEEAYDLRATALAQLNKFDQALAACAPDALRPPPVQLKLRAAWVEAQRGNVSVAVERAKRALAEYPDYLDGWKWLADWHLQLNQLEEAIQAVEHMPRLAPLDPVPLGYLGELKARNQDKAGAKAAFVRAFRLDPDYHFAGFRVFRMQLEARELTEAKQTLDILARGGHNHDTLACAIEHACACQATDEAIELFERLCADPKASEWSISTGARAIDQSGRGGVVDRLIDERLEKGSFSPALAECWVSTAFQHRKFNIHRRLRKLQQHGEPARAAVIRYLDCLAENYETARREAKLFAPSRLRHHFRKVMNAHRDWLRTHTLGWGKVGYVYATLDDPRKVVSWLADWKTQPNVESWMLYNLVISLQKLHRYDAALEVVRYAVAMRHWQDLYETFQSWAAFEEVLRGNVDQAERHLMAVPVASENKYANGFRVMAQLLVDLARPEAKETARSVRARLRAAYVERHPAFGDAYTKNAYGRFMRHASRRLGIGFRIWGWFYFHFAAALRLR